mmetsp:Transcript_17669/g.29474  ORF Transcript_17669/g.29474 Transcript_17669/m.29474 type:complete len:142 (-) Transcript_17669:103-528(-)
MFMRAHPQVYTSTSHHNSTDSSCAWRPRLRYPECQPKKEKCAVGVQHYTNRARYCAPSTTKTPSALGELGPHSVKRCFALSQVAAHSSVLWQTQLTKACVAKANGADWKHRQENALVTVMLLPHCGSPCELDSQQQWYTRC